MKLFIWLSLFTLATLACGAQASLPVDTQMPTPTSTEVNSTDVGVVIADTLHIRNAPNGQVLKPYLVRGQKVTILDRKIKDGYEWCKIEAGKWVACWWLR